MTKILNPGVQLRRRAINVATWLIHWISFSTVTASISSAVSSISVPFPEGPPYVLYGTALLVVVAYCYRYRREINAQLD